ncbi:hypothetical protein [Dyadobacter frigoris]|uniref:DUF2158 domain-containing protein n=1 Tax=Dyadobacter frigoris TaxID=2576211 RepID=A0A4V6BIX3_9BACT|nr:hypothetical protein [Dyadobacter frigoris]TKT90773.1 hypothetical protein FDK13_17550 [Dyadobacter frigoris]GLU52108.1 hypothetical protein Dfri01_15690 [Dyadobacter frigoris]
MSKPKFNEGAWVKEKTGTKGMTVVSNITDKSTSEFSGKVICKYGDEEGHDVEGEFSEVDLVSL